MRRFLWTSPGRGGRPPFPPAPGSRAMSVFRRPATARWRRLHPSVPYPTATEPSDGMRTGRCRGLVGKPRHPKFGLARRNFFSALWHKSESIGDDPCVGTPGRDYGKHQAVVSSALSSAGGPKSYEMEEARAMDPDQIQITVFIPPQQGTPPHDVQFHNSHNRSWSPISVAKVSGGPQNALAYVYNCYMVEDNDGALESLWLGQSGQQPFWPGDIGSSV